mmetsp:Transcript_57797/g.113784  ORF Transcript_57797/g.113784 Transcript_57797/m.113784 type:complete len:253 (-) Transcript_57797:375-1133(-)
MASPRVVAVQYAAYRSRQADPDCLGFSCCHWHRHSLAFAPARSSRFDSAAAGVGAVGGGSGGGGSGGGSGGGGCWGGGGSTRPSSKMSATRRWSRSSATGLSVHAARSSMGSWLEVALPGFALPSCSTTSAREMGASRSGRTSRWFTAAKATSWPPGRSRTLLYTLVKCSAAAAAFSSGEVQTLPLVSKKGCWFTGRDCGPPPLSTARTTAQKSFTPSAEAASSAAMNSILYALTARFSSFCAAVQRSLSHA